MLAISLPLSLIVLLCGLQYDSHIATAVSIFAAMLLVMLPVIIKQLELSGFVGKRFEHSIVLIGARDILDYEPSRSIDKMHLFEALDKVAVRYNSSYVLLDDLSKQVEDVQRVNGGLKHCCSLIDRTIHIRI